MTAHVRTLANKYRFAFGKGFPIGRFQDSIISERWLEFLLGGSGTVGFCSQYIIQSSVHLHLPPHPPRVKRHGRKLDGGEQRRK